MNKLKSLRGKLLLSSLLILLLTGMSHAEQYQWRNNGYLRQSSTYEDRTNIYDKKGKYEGYLKQDSLSENRRTYIYDKDGKEKGYIRQDPVFKNRVIIDTRK